MDARREPNGAAGPPVGAPDGSYSVPRRGGEPYLGTGAAGCGPGASVNGRCRYWPDQALDDVAGPPCFTRQAPDAALSAADGLGSGDLEDVAAILGFWVLLGMALRALWGRRPFRYTVQGSLLVFAAAVLVW